MEVRIGVVQSAKEIELEMAEGTTPESVVATVEKVLGKEDAILRLEDRKGRQVLVHSGRIAYVEVGSSEADRRVGFGASVKAQ